MTTSSPVKTKFSRIESVQAANQWFEDDIICGDTVAEIVWRQLVLATFFEAKDFVELPPHAVMLNEFEIAELTLLMVSPDVDFTEADIEKRMKMIARTGLLDQLCVEGVLSRALNKDDEIVFCIKKDCWLLLNRGPIVKDAIIEYKRYEMSGAPSIEAFRRRQLEKTYSRPSAVRK